MLLVGCTELVPRVTPELVGKATARDPAANDATLTAGREFYLTRCGSCHALIAPTAYDPDEWRSWMHSMGPKAHLAKPQEAQVLAYVLAARDVTLAPAGKN